MAQSEALNVQRIRRAAFDDVELLTRTHNLLVQEWNAEIDGGHNRHGHHTSQYTMRRTTGILKAVGMAVADAEDRAYERGQQRQQPISRQPSRCPSRRRAPRAQRR